MKNTKTNCINGHPYSKENTYIDKAGNKRCKKCRMISLKKYFKNHPEKDKHGHRSYFRERYHADPIYKEQVKNSVKKWSVKNQHKIKAHKDVHKAMKSGKMTRLPCEVCKNPRTDAHHPDYSKPLSVIWLCRKHHTAQHEIIKRLELDKK